VARSSTVSFSFPSQADLAQRWVAPSSTGIVTATPPGHCAELCRLTVGVWNSARNLPMRRYSGSNLSGANVATSLREYSALSNSREALTKSASLTADAPGKWSEQTGTCAPFTLKTSSCLSLLTYGRYSTVPLILREAIKRCRAAAILSVVSPFAGAVPLKYGTSLLMASANSSSLNQTKFSNTTGRLTADSSTSKVTVAAPLALRTR